jgi:hypothetical protein
VTTWTGSARPFITPSEPRNASAIDVGLAVIRNQLSLPVLSFLISKTFPIRTFFESKTPFSDATSSSTSNAETPKRASAVESESFRRISPT